MDYRNQIFTMLGVEPFEHFKILGNDANTYRFDDHLKVEAKTALMPNGWEGAGVQLVGILNGTFKIVKSPKLTDKDKIIIEYAKVCGYNWIATDAHGACFAYVEKPSRNIAYWLELDGSLTQIEPLSFQSWNDEPYYIGE